MTRKDSGFTPAILILGIVALGIVGLLGYVAVRAIAQQPAASSTASSSTPTQAPAVSASTEATTSDTPKTTPSVAATPSKPGYVTIKEWNIGFKIGDASNASHMSYAIKTDDNGNTIAQPYISNPNDPGCRDIAIAFVKAGADATKNDKNVKLGDSYYSVEYAVGSICDKHTTDEAPVLMDSINNSLDRLDYDIIAL